MGTTDGTNISGALQESLACREKAMAWQLLQFSRVYCAFIALSWWLVVYPAHAATIPVQYESAPLIISTWQAFPSPTGLFFPTTAEACNDYLKHYGCGSISVVPTTSLGMGGLAYKCVTSLCGMASWAIGFPATCPVATPSFIYNRLNGLCERSTCPINATLVSETNCTCNTNFQPDTNATACIPICALPHAHATNIPSAPCACDAGYIWDAKKTRCVTTMLSVTANAPVIPLDSRVQSKRIFTQAALTLTLQKGNDPANGVLVGLKSDRAGQDALSGPTNLTDAAGKTTATISTWNQPGISVVSASDTINIQTLSPGVVNWLPADYENKFLTTCYSIAVEADTPVQPTNNKVCGLPGKTYRTGFLKDVKMQGSGVALNGQIVHYKGNGCFNFDTCARTASGACAVVGTTIAVDPSVIPRGSKVAIDLLGGRIAQDGGGWINGYHIDNYMGAARAACLSFGRQFSKITFQNY
jgi:3D (Asp-Asp-Asp) domain-containing protein